MKEKTKRTLLIVAAIIIVGYLVVNNFQGLTINLPSGSAGSESNLPPTYNPPEYPDYPSDYDDSTSVAPTSLTIDLHPNPLYAGYTLTGDVVAGYSSTGDDYRYPITVHAKHVGEGTEQTYGALLDDTGRFTDSRVVDVPGYWDFWVTTNTGVTSNKPRVEVRGALLTMSRTFWSKSNPFGSDPTTVINVFCHSGGSCTIFYNDGSSSTPLETIYVNSGGYASTTFNIDSLGNGNYEMDFVVNGIKASDYGNSVFFTVGR